jgi:alginate O-acetyltransferase complex protein AlgI
MHIYIPLGGNRIGSFKQVKNIFITMLIGGIWHGASWNFLLWGGYHGFLIVLEKITKSIIGVKIPLVFNKYFIFILITIGWVPFRCQSISSTKLMLKNLFLFKNINLNIYTNNLHIEVISIILIFLFVMFLPNSNQIQSDLKRVTIKNKYLLLLYLVFAYAVIFFLLAEPNQNINREFIYFQF